MEHSIEKSGILKTTKIKKLLCTQQSRFDPGQGRDLIKRFLPGTRRNGGAEIQSQFSVPNPKFLHTSYAYALLK